MLQVLDCSANDYNDLPDIMEADKQLRLLGRESIVETLCNVILKFRLQDRIGIRLLHRHSVIDDNESMVERDEFDSSGRPCLATRVEPQSSARTALANTWRIHSGKLHAYEYSSPESLNSPTARIDAEFITEFEKVTTQNSVTRLLGLCLIDKKFFQLRPGAETDYGLVEESDVQARTNVVRWVPAAEINSLTYIQAMWKASVVDDPILGCKRTHVGCTQNCAVIIHCNPADTGHDQSRRHHTSHAKDYTHDFIP